jgi:hypothetical protein
VKEGRPESPVDIPPRRRKSSVAGTVGFAPKAKDVWTVPFGGGVGRIMKVGAQPINLSAQVYANAVYPTGGSPWGIRLQIAFLFPQLTSQQQIMMLEQRLKELQSQQGTKN